jgi:hypothetical protein
MRILCSWGGDSLEVPIGRLLCLLSLAALMMACAAKAANVASSDQQVRAPNRFIYVTAQELPGECYRDLGVVKFDEPFTDSVIDEDGSRMAQRMREQALKDYPKDADAVIDVQKQQNDAGTAVTVVGEAVELRNYETPICAMRKMPGVLDKSAAIAAGGIVGTAVMGSLSNTVQGAETGAALGAAGVGKYVVSDQQQQTQFKEEEVKHQLEDQRRQINELLAERSRLQECQQEETSLADCDASQAPAKQNVAQKNSDTPFNGSEYDLEKQIQEQQVYIDQLKGQVSDLRHSIGGN